MEDLKEVDGMLHSEYTVRRRMLLERLKVTLQVCVGVCVGGVVVGGTL
jgi:hypothetical protein